MIITIRKLKELNACKEGTDWFQALNETDHEAVISKLMAEDNFSWANWLIVRLMTHKQKVQYAVFAAEQVIDIFEAKYPQDKRPRAAIEAAKAWIENPNEENRRASAAAYAAAAYATAAYAAAAASSSYAAYAAAADASSSYAADAAVYAAYAAAGRRELRTKIINFGLELLRSKT